MSEQITEKKSTGDESAVMDPVAPSGGDPEGKNRKADKNSKVDPKADEIEDDVKTPTADGSKTKAPARKADKAAVKESVEEMFGGDELSEDFKERASVVFEAALNEQLKAQYASLEEQFDARLVEETESILEDVTTKLDAYLDYVVERWMEDNELAIEQGIKSEMAESFMTGLANLFSENNIDLPEDKVDVVAEMNAEMEELRNQLDESKNEAIALRNQLNEATIEDVFEEVSEGLAETQVDKLKGLSEGIEYKDVDEYKRKLNIIRENYFAKPAVETQPLNEEVDENADPEAGAVKHVDPNVARYADALSKHFRK